MEMPSPLLDQLTNSIRRAVWRMERSQHMDGGWGLQVERSNFWHTAYAVLFLNAARELPELHQLPDIEGMLAGGVSYLEQHSENWSADTLSRVAGMSVYEISLMARCFYQVGRAFLRRESALRVFRSIDRLYHSQNDDGGWDANIWGYEVTTPVRIWSEVGATSAALQAMAAVEDNRFRAAAERGVKWLAATQNPDGSWNNGSCHPSQSEFQLSGQPTLNKTCDALQAILAAGSLEVSPQPFRGCIDHAADWLHKHGQPVLEQQGYINGRGYSTADYESISLALEALVRVPDTPLSLLASNAVWLLQGQRRQDDDLEDGSWVMGHTARIALALVAFYHRLKKGVTIRRTPWIP